MDLKGAVEVPETPRPNMKKEGEAGEPYEIEDDSGPTPCDKDDHDYHPTRGEQKTQGKKRTRSQARSGTDTPACASSPSEQAASKKPKTDSKSSSPIKLKVTNRNKGKRLEDNARLMAFFQEISNDVSEKNVKLLQVEQENEKLKARMTQLEDRLGLPHGVFSDLSSKVEQKEKENEHLQQRLQQTRDLIANVSQDYEQLQSRLDKEREDYRPVYDDEIVSKWRGLQFAIQNLVMVRLAARPILTDDEDDEDDSAAIQTARLCDSQPRLAIFHLQNHIWKRLISDVFQGNKEIVLGRVSKIYFAYRKRLTVEAHADPSKGKALSHLKSNAAHELIDIYGVDATVKDALVQVMANELRLFVLEEEPMDTCLEDLAAIVDKAVDLHSIFIKSKAFFIIGSSGLKPGKDVDLNKCEVYQEWREKPEEERKIEVIASPLVMKLGNAAGHEDSFGIAYPICKARVVIG